jgi:hypothetical protein
VFGLNFITAASLLDVIDDHIVDFQLSTLELDDKLFILRGKKGKGLLTERFELRIG